MRILFVISSLGIGGEQRAASNLTDYFVKHGHRVSLLSFSSQGEKHIDFNADIRMVFCAKRTSNIYRMMSIRSEILRNKYDVVIGFAVIPSILASFARIGTHAPVVVCERNDPAVYSALWKSVRILAYRFAKGAVFQTAEASNYFGSSYFKKRIVIPNPICDNLKCFQRDVDNREKVIVNTSRLTEPKRQHLIINAFARVAEDYPAYRLAFYGDGNCLEALENQAKTLHMEHRITFNPATTDIFSKIASAEIFVLASAHEGFPNSLAEAMGLGLVAVSVDCRIGGPKDMIQNGVNGLLIKENDSTVVVIFGSL